MHKYIQVHTESKYMKSMYVHEKYVRTWEVCTFISSNLLYYACLYICICSYEFHGVSYCCFMLCYVMFYHIVMLFVQWLYVASQKLTGIHKA